MPPVLDLLIIGGQRCGSTWLSSTLEQHPQIVMGAPKELHYFNRFVLAHDLRWYRSHFADGDRGDGVLLGEATPAYGSLGAAPVEALRDALPDLRVVLVLRNPIERTWSHLCSRFGPGPNRPVEALALRRALYQLHRRTTRDHNDFLMTIDRWGDAFGLDHLHLIRFDDLAHDGQGTLQELTRSLGLDDHVFDLERGRRFGAHLIDMPPELRWHLHRTLGPVVRAQADRLGPLADGWLSSLETTAPAPGWERRHRAYRTLGLVERVVTKPKVDRRSAALAEAITRAFSDEGLTRSLR